MEHEWSTHDNWQSLRITKGTGETVLSATMRGHSKMGHLLCVNDGEFKEVGVDLFAVAKRAGSRQCNARTRGRVQRQDTGLAELLV